MKIMVNAFDQNEQPYDRDPSQNTFAQFLVNSGLYESYEVSAANIHDLIDVINGNVRINIYCKECEESRIFSMKEVLFPFDNSRGELVMRSLGNELSQNQRVQELCETPGPGEQSVEKEWYWTNCQTKAYTRVMVFQYQCALNEQHYTDYVVRANGNIIIKIGQYPSVADLAFPELKDYKKILSKDDMREIRRAIGLYAQGIGVGSFVYLRRIFEHLIDSAKNTAISEGKFDEESYVKAHVDERIKMLKDYLPAMLVDNPVFYSIVSKGIHELSEEECTTYFPVLKDAIFVILRQWEQLRQEKEANAQLAASMAKIASKIK